MNADSISFEYLLKLRQLTWENAEVIDNIFGSIAVEEKSGEQKTKFENWCKVNCEEASNSNGLCTKEGCRQNSERAEGKLYQTVDYTRAINVHVVLTSLDSHEYIRDHNSCGVLSSQPEISFENTYFSKDDPTIAATHSEHFQRHNVCSICHKHFTCKSHLIRHFRTHTGDKPFGCPQCVQKFAHKGDLKTHLLIHSGFKEYSCKICYKQFRHKSSLTIHLRTHTGEKPFGCPQCEKKFAQKQHLKKHLLIHSGVKKFSCDICQSTFIDRSTLKSHLLVHSSTKPFSCDFCYKTFRRKSHLKGHLRTHTGDKPFNECNAMFSQSSTLTTHMRTHTGETPYQCEICGRKFSELGNLKTHLLIHSAEKPFACNYANCDKTFRRKDELQSHIRVHTKEKPYACPNCKKTFSWSGHCKTHAKQCSVTKSVSSGDSSAETGEK